MGNFPEFNYSKQQTQNFGKQLISKYPLFLLLGTFWIAILILGAIGFAFLTHPGEPVPPTQPRPKTTATAEQQQTKTSYLLLFIWILLGSAASSWLLTLALKHFTLSHQDRKKCLRKIAATSSQNDTTREGGFAGTGGVGAQYCKNTHDPTKIQGRKIKSSPSVKRTQKKNKQGKSSGSEVSQLMKRKFSTTDSTKSSELEESPVAVRLVDVVDLRKRRSLSSLMNKKRSKED